MKKLFVLLLLPIATIFVTDAYAQQQDKILKVTYTSTDERQASYIETFFDLLEADLVSNGVRLEYRKGEPDQTTNLNIVFEPIEIEPPNIAGVIVRVENIYSEIESISPILYNLPDIWINTYSEEEAVQFISAMAYSAINQCEAAYSSSTQLMYLDHERVYEIFPERFNAPMRDLIWINCAIINENYQEVISLYEGSAVFYTPTSHYLSSRIRVNSAWAYFQQGDIDKAFSTINLQINFFPQCSTCNDLLVELYTKRAQFHALNNDFDAALADINTALELYYDSVDSPFNVDPAILAPLFVQRGQIHLFLYEWDKVLDDYNTALQIDPDYADPYYYRGVLYYSVRFEREKAIPDFERYLELAPDGELAEKAQQYLTDIQAELKALER